jgi:hypothetical protein
MLSYLWSSLASTGFTSIRVRWDRQLAAKSVLFPSWRCSSRRTTPSLGVGIGISVKKNSSVLNLPLKLNVAWIPFFYSDLQKKGPIQYFLYQRFYGYQLTDERSWIVSKCFWRWCCITAIYFLDFIDRPYVFQPQRFEGWLFPRHQVNLFWWLRSIRLASIGGVGSPDDEGRTIPRNVVVEKHGDDG